MRRISPSLVRTPDERGAHQDQINAVCQSNYLRDLERARPRSDQSSRLGSSVARCGLPATNQPARDSELGSRTISLDNFELRSGEPDSNGRFGDESSPAPELRARRASSASGLGPFVRLRAGDDGSLASSSGAARLHGPAGPRGRGTNGRPDRNRQSTANEPESRKKQLAAKKNAATPAKRALVDRVDRVDGGRIPTGLDSQ